MKALLLAAHGSRRAPSNSEVAALAERMAGLAGPGWAWVGHGFLELASPDIPAAVDQAVAAGADEILVLPYFLAAGRHVREDLPAQVETARRRHAGVAIRLVPHLGAARGLAELLWREVAAADA